MRKWVVFIIMLLFNFLFIYGIKYTNRILYDKNFMIYLNKKDDPIVDDNPTNIEEEVVDTSFNGESIEQIGKKMNKIFVKSFLDGHGESIARIAISKSVNPYLVGGIILESTNCRSDCSVLLKQCNNVFGKKGEPGCFGGTYQKYSSVEESVKDLVNIIRDKFESKDEQNPYKMYKKYGKNEIWAFKVNKNMEILKRGK